MYVYDVYMPISVCILNMFFLSLSLCVHFCKYLEWYFAGTYMISSAGGFILVVGSF